MNQRQMEAVCDLIRTSVDLAPWVSASLAAMKLGHTDDYPRAANEFLEAVKKIEGLAP